MPAQPPFLTPTRTPMIGLGPFAITYFMRSAAASVRRVTWGLGRELAIAASFFRRSSLVISCGMESRQAQLATCSSQFQHTTFRHAFSTLASPHIEHGPRLVRHPALLPGRIPDDVDLD